MNKANQIYSQAIRTGLDTIGRNMTPFATMFPDNVTRENIYYPRTRDGYAIGDNFDWTTSFWPGQLWLAFELSGEDDYCLAAKRLLPSFINRIDNQIDIDTHDLGFLYTLSCVAAWRLRGMEPARQAALKAADYLMTRCLENVGVIQAWGDLNDPKQRGRTIIDSLLNMPLLYWASEQTGDPHYTTVAHRHTELLRDYIVRDDDTTFHTFYWNPETGEPLFGRTEQGHADDSCWARGQAWGILGFALNYRYTRDRSFLATAQRLADYFLDHLPSDHVTYWDMVFSDGSGEERDSSAAAIAVCGLQELLHWLPEGALRERYAESAENILQSLAQNYAPTGESNALLLHSVYDKPKMVGVDEGCLWGDYFYLEALMRQTNPEWQLYW